MTRTRTAGDANCEMARTDQKWQLNLEDRLDLIRYAPRERALEILHLLLEAVYGEGYIRGAEGIKENLPRRIPIGASGVETD